MQTIDTTMSVPLKVYISPEEQRDADCVARLGLPRMLAPAPGHNGPRAFAFGRCSLGLDKREHSRKEISATCLKNQV